MVNVPDSSFANADETNSNIYFGKLIDQKEVSLDSEKSVERFLK